MYLILIIFHIAITATGQNIDFIDDELTINSSCLIHATRQQGKCIHINDCPSVLSALPKISPQTCFLENRIPIVCCPIYEKIIIKHIDRNFSNSKIINMCYNYYADKDTDPYVICYYKENCFLKDSCEEKHVSFGLRAPILEHMYMASLGWRLDNDDYDFRCGAFLVARNFVLTAAHCMQRSNPDIVRLGDKMFKKYLSQDIDVANIYIHPEYKLFLTYNDIAIIKLAKEADPQFILACLWVDDPNLAFDFAAIGFGATEFGGGTSNFLYSVFLDLMNNTVCNEEFSGDSQLPNGTIYSQLCAGDPKRRMDTCSGDSGGPLFTLVDLIFGPECRIQPLIAHVMGITSFGQVCGESLAAIYTRISPYLDWIDSIVFEN